MKPKTARLTFFLLVFSLLMSSSIPLPAGGYFNMETGQVACFTPFACLHEQGHVLDKSLSWPSTGEGWKYAVDVYRRVVWNCPASRDETSYMIEFFPGIGSPYLPDNNPMNYSFWHGGWGGYTELYASIYAETGGDVNAIPSGLRPFYLEVDSGESIY